MCKHFFAILVILKVIHISVQQPCKLACLSDAFSDDNCVKRNEIKANATLNKIKGIVDFQFDFECSVQTYKIVVFYNRKICSNFIQHSIYRLRKIHPYETNIVHLDKCAKTGRVFLQNIQTGCYRIDLVNLANGDIIYSNTSYWQTSYLRQELDLLKTNITYDTRNNGTELIFVIKNAILHSHPEFSIQFECENCPKYMSNKHSYDLVRDKTNPDKLILGPKENNAYLNIYCDLIQHIAEDRFASCFLSPVTVGHYNIVITFVGDPYQCASNKLKVHHIRLKNIVVNNDEHLGQPLKYSEPETIVGPVLIIISIFLTSFIIILTIKSIQVYIRVVGKVINYVETDDQNTNNMEVHVDDGLGENRTKPNLLLLYARNSEDIMTILSLFRNIFIHQGIEVFDVYDPERLSEINENNFNWILNIISRKDIKIIVFLTPSARNLSNLPQMQNSIDNIYPFAMKHLLNQLSNHSEFYKKIFVTYFSFDIYKYSDYEIFSPYLRFRVPDDFLALFHRILNTKRIYLNYKSSNEYNMFMKHYEKFKCSQGNIINHI